ncbi:iron-sulfur protein [Clostridia bacterium]|nr:iron-sulfur protein [Clostridia bacterium]
MSNTIYYFSATGNSLQAALDIAGGLGDTEVISIPKAGRNAVCGSDVIGFVFPVFSFGLPNMVRDFIASGAFKKDAYFFTVVTCGMVIGGCTAELDALLREKGSRLSYGKRLRMVENYIAMQDVKPHTQGKILAKSEKTLASIIVDLRARKQNKPKKGLSFTRKMHDKYSAQYKEADRDLNVSAACTGCGACARVCPAKNIVIAEGKPTFLHNCEHCLACIHWCPARALNYKDKTQNKRRYHHPKIRAEQLTGGDVL